ncbi:hypothetical protein STEG23_022181, partial [Scotinomys teguina]
KSKSEIKYGKAMSSGANIIYNNGIAVQLSGEIIFDADKEENVDFLNNFIFHIL